MEDVDGERRSARCTRARLLRAAMAGGGILAGGAALGARGGHGTSLAASASTDAEILNAFLLLEYVQQNFYDQAIKGDRLRGALLLFARTVGRQEAEHAAFLTERLGSKAAKRPRSDFGDALRTPDRFVRAAVELEERTIAAYIGQGANLRRSTLAAVVPMVSVEARQVAWVRDLDGTSPAPHAADPAGNADDILADLRKEGYLR